MSKTKYSYSIEHIDLGDLTSKRTILESLKAHDYDSFMFSFFTGAFNYALSKELGHSDELNRLYFECGLFHDTGKLGMEYNFINYPGQFTLHMYNEMKKHTTGGAQLLKHVASIEQDIIDTAQYHHCNYDGSGYPGNLFGEEIPFAARLTRVSDSLDAYLSKRCYKDGGPAKEAFDDLNSYVETSYDPKIIDAFSRVHFKIIDECHRDGEDRPSKDMYTYYLIELYLKDFEMNTMESVLERV